MTMLVIFGLCVRSLVMWVAPKADMAITKHFEGFDKMIQTQGEIAGTQTKIVETQQAQAENGRMFVEISKQHRDQTEVIGRKLDEVHRAVVTKTDGK